MQITFRQTGLSLNLKKVSEVRKKWKANAWNLDLGQKWQNEKKCVLTPQLVHFFSLYNQKMRKKGLQIYQTHNWKTSPWSTKKVRD